MKTRSSHPSNALEVVTVTLNPAIDQTLEIPRFRAGQVHRVQGVLSRPGGKGVNVAAALADAGHGVAVTGFLGRANAACFETMFAERRIRDHFVRLPGATRTGLKIVDPVNDQTTDINFPGLAPGRAALRLLEARLARWAAPGRWFALSGSLPPGVAPDFYARLTRRLRKQGARVLLDTSGEPLRLALEARPDILKPNLHELETLTGRKLSGLAAVRRAARRLLEGGIGMVVVSMGEQGACLVTAEKAVLAIPPSVKVRSTVGAGDAMVAGILSAHLRGLSLEATARLATAFSLEVLTRGESGLGSRAAVSRRARQVGVSPQKGSVQK